MSKEPRNMDLIVRHGPDDFGASAHFDFGDRTVGEVANMFDKFDHPSQMTAFEFSAYAAYGDDECNRDDILTLEDLFGTEFHDAFFERKNYLLDMDNLQELYEEREQITKRINSLEKKLCIG